MADVKNVRRPSPLQRRVLIVLAALDEKRPGPVLTLIENGFKYPCPDAALCFLRHFFLSL